eukprot:5914490-Prorocentrum_lima.AAC.1
MTPREQYSNALPCGGTCRNGASGSAHREARAIPTGTATNHSRSRTANNYRCECGYWVEHTGHTTFPN